MPSRSLQGRPDGLFTPRSGDETLPDARLSRSNISLGFGDDISDLPDDGYGEGEDPGFEDEMNPDGAIDDGRPPAGLKEISSLASWTVSTAKQGCGVAALRSSDNSLFWQSDGPQPHLLSIHFFKLVSIVHMRIYLDHEADESYTPTKIQFWAGMGVHDVQEFAEMTFEQPKGWIEVDFSKVGPITSYTEDNAEHEIDWSTRPVLRAFLVQVRIIENHQNGKDTHLRGLQIFARDTNLPPPMPTPATKVDAMPVRSKAKYRQMDEIPISKACWMLEPELR